MEDKAGRKGRVIFTPIAVQNCIDGEIRAERQKKKKAFNELEAAEHMTAQCALQRVRVAIFGEAFPPEG